MKVFGIYAVVELVDSPKWLEPFREKYTGNPIAHITLMQVRIVEERDIAKVQEKLVAYFQSSPVNDHQLKVEFDYVHEDALASVSDTELCIMLHAKENQQLIQLQRDIVQLLGNYAVFFNPITEEYEANFHPHLTIGDHLNIEQYHQAFLELPKEHIVRGVIHEIHLDTPRLSATGEIVREPGTITKYQL